MSDFGAMLVISKSNGFTDTDNETIKKALKKVISKGDYSSLITEGNYQDLKNWDNDKLASLLTEYYIDENYEEIFEFTKEEDLEDAESISKELQVALGNEYKVNAAFEAW